MRKRLAILPLLLLAGCTSGPGIQGNRGGSLTASPQALISGGTGSAATAFPVLISGASDLDRPLNVSLTNPALMSASVTAASPGSATVSVLRVGSGAASVVVTDRGGASVTIPVAWTPCGRPDALTSAQLIYPQPGATGVPVNTTKLYFIAGYVFNTQTATFIHAAVGAHSAAEGGQLQSATPPPGAATPTPPPIPNTTFSTWSGAPPPLQAGMTYTVYLYDDACEVPYQAGSFST